MKQQGPSARRKRQDPSARIASETVVQRSRPARKLREDPPVGFQHVKRKDDPSARPAMDNGSKRSELSRPVWSDEPLEEDGDQDYLSLQRRLRDKRRSSRRLSESHSQGPVPVPTARSPTPEVVQEPKQARNQGLHAMRASSRRGSVREHALEAMRTIGRRHGETDEWKTFLRSSSTPFLDVSISDSDEDAQSHAHPDEEDPTKGTHHHQGDLHHGSHEHGHGHHHHDQHHQSLNLPWYCPPIQRQLWGDEHILPHVNWQDLFFDLLFVAAAFNLGTMLTSSMKLNDWPRGVIYFIGIFGHLYNIWERDAVYAARFTLVDYSHRIAAVLRFLSVSFVVLSVKPLELLADHHSAETFCLTTSLFCESLIQLALNLELYLYGDGDRQAIQAQTLRETITHVLPRSLTYLVAAIIAGYSYFSFQEPDDFVDGHHGLNSGNFATNNATAHGLDTVEASGAYGASNSSSSYSTTTAISNAGHFRFLDALVEHSVESSTSHSLYNMQWSIADVPLFLCFCTYIIGVFFSVIQASTFNTKNYDVKQYFVPNNIDFMIHRYGEWVMLMIGESILSLMMVQTTEAIEYYGITILGCLTVIILQMLKYESEPSHADGHALWRSMSAAAVYAVLVQILSMGLIATGVSYKLMLKEVLHRFVTETYDRRLSGASAEISYEAAAWMFCISLGVVLLSMVCMLATHRGVRKTIQLVFRESEVAGIQSLNWPLAIIYFLKAFIICFTFTLAQWVIDPYYLTICGFLLVTAMATIRMVGYSFVYQEGHLYNTMNYLGQSINLNFTEESKGTAEKNTAAVPNGELCTPTAERKSIIPFSEDAKSPSQGQTPSMSSSLAHHSRGKSPVKDKEQPTHNKVHHHVSAAEDITLVSGSKPTPHLRPDLPAETLRKPDSERPTMVIIPSLAAVPETVTFATGLSESHHASHSWVAEMLEFDPENRQQESSNSGGLIQQENGRPGASQDELPPGWETAYDPTSHKKFYFHIDAHITQWERPANLPNSWSMARDDATGRIYYYHANGKTQWEEPL